MERQRFDQLTRVLEHGITRRTALGLLAGLAGGRLAEAFPGETAAKRRQKQRAVAASGAQTDGGPITIDQCQTFADGSTYCVQAKGESHATRTPSGNFNTQINFQFECVSLTDPQGRLTYRFCYQNEHFKFQEKADETHVVHSAWAETSTTTSGQTCSVVARSHFANGQYQYTDLEETCR